MIRVNCEKIHLNGLYIHKHSNTTLRAEIIGKNNIVEVTPETIDKTIFKMGHRFPMHSKTLTNHYDLVLEEGSIWSRSGTRIKLGASWKGMVKGAVEKREGTSLATTFPINLPINPEEFPNFWTLENVGTDGLNVGDVFEFRENTDEDWDCDSIIQIKKINDDNGMVDTLLLGGKKGSLREMAHPKTSRLNRWSWRFKNKLLYRKVIPMYIEDLGTRQI